MFIPAKGVETALGFNDRVKLALPVLYSSVAPLKNRGNAASSIITKSSSSSVTPTSMYSFTRLYLACSSAHWLPTFLHTSSFVWVDGEKSKIRPFLIRLLLTTIKIKKYAVIGAGMEGLWIGTYQEWDATNTCAERDGAKSVLWAQRTKWRLRKKTAAFQMFLSLFQLSIPFSREDSKRCQRVTAGIKAMPKVRWLHKYRDEVKGESTERSCGEGAKYFKAHCAAAWTDKAAA